MTDPADVKFLSKQSLHDFPKALVGFGDHSIRFVEVQQVCAEWLQMWELLTEATGAIIIAAACVDNPEIKNVLRETVEKIKTAIGRSE